jgi:hypothetical protein
LGEVANVRNGLFYDGVVYCIAHTRLFSIVLLNSQPNAGGEPRPKAGAQRTLEGVGSTALFGADSVSGTPGACEIALGFQCRLWTNSRTVWLNFSGSS